MSGIGWDQSFVYSTSVLPGEVQTDAPKELEKQFKDFIQEFILDNSYIYR